MIRTPFVAIRIAALSVAFVAAAYTSAHALPHLGMHRHPAPQQQDARIDVHIYNTSASFRDVKVGDRVYTVLPHQGLEIKAPAGTAVISETTGNLHRKGDLLFAVTPEMKDKTISIN